MFAKIDKEFCKCKRIIDFFKDITKFSNFFYDVFLSKNYGNINVFHDIGDQGLQF